MCGTHFDLLTTAFMLTCCTGSLVACLRLMTRRRLWKFSTSAPLPAPLSYSRFPLSAARTWRAVSKRSSHQHSGGCLLTVLCLARERLQTQGVCP